MSLTDITCCHGGPHTIECDHCSHSPRYVTRQDLELEHKRQLVRESVGLGCCDSCGRIVRALVSVCMDCRLDTKANS